MASILPVAQFPRPCRTILPNHEAGAEDQPAHELRPEEGLVDVDLPEIDQAEVAVETEATMATTMAVNITRKTAKL
ncbi:MAG: hypothetical protein U0263_17455 [Polyangiaceae bacterium]